MTFFTAFLIAVFSLLGLAVIQHPAATPFDPAAVDVMRGILPGDPQFPRTNPRLVYPYSVIPGGVATAEELQAVAEIDPVVRGHYRGVEASKLRPVALPEAKTAQVSYRVGDQVYWTRNKVRIPKGELVLTDGENLIRARCGNRISEQPQLPVAEAGEPPEEVLETALVIPPPIPVEPVPSEAESGLGFPALESERPVAGYFVAPAAKMGWWKPLLFIAPALAAAGFLPDDGPAPAPAVTPVPPVGEEPLPPPAEPPAPPTTEPPPPPTTTEPQPPPPSGPSDPPAPPAPPTDPEPPQNPPDQPSPPPPPEKPEDPPVTPPKPPVPPPPPPLPPWQDPDPPGPPPPTDPPTDPPQPPVDPPPPPLTPVPEPSFYAVLGVGLVGVIAVARRRKRK